MIDKIMNGTMLRIYEEQRSELDKPFVRGEIEWTNQIMNPIKATGPDEVQAIFYQKYWEIVGDEWDRRY